MKLDISRINRKKNITITKIVLFIIVTITSVQQPVLEKFKKKLSNHGSNDLNENLTNTFSL